MFSETAKSALKSLLARGWDKQPSAEGELFVVRKTCQIDVDVVVRICSATSGFVVESNAEHRTSGPVQTEVGASENLETAVNILIECCSGWEMSSDKINWSEWHAKT